MTRDGPRVNPAPTKPPPPAPPAPPGLAAPYPYDDILETIDAMDGPTRREFLARLRQLLELGEAIIALADAGGVVLHPRDAAEIERLRHAPGADGRYRS